MSSNYCVACGCEIPEGRHVCIFCEQGYTPDAFSRMGRFKIGAMSAVIDRYCFNCQIFEKRQPCLECKVKLLKEKLSKAGKRK